MANSPILQIPLLATSQAAKEQTINQMVSQLERAMNDATQINLAGGNYTLPLTDLQRYFVFRMVAPGATSTFTITPAKRLFVIDNVLNAQPVTVQAGAATQVIPVNGTVVLYCDGVNLISIADSTITGGGVAPPTSFTALTDTPTTYAGSPKFTVKVKEDMSGLELVLVKLSDGSDVDVTGIVNGQVLAWHAVSGKFIPVDLPTGGAGAGGVSPVDAATIDEIIINDALAPGQTVDTFPLAIGSRVLVKHQTLAVDNGIYVVTAGSPTRSSDYPDDTDFPAGTEVLVMNGAENRYLTYVQTQDNGVVGLTPLTFNRYVQTFANLPDVDVDGIANGQSIRWNNVLNKFVAFTPGGSGAGLPDGGTVGQIIKKTSNVDGEADWYDNVLAGLTDVDVTGIDPGSIINYVLGYDKVDEKWKAVENTGGGGGTLASLSDVDFSTPPVDGQSIVYDEVAGKWKPGAGGGGGSVKKEVSAFAPGNMMANDVILIYPSISPIVFSATGSICRSSAPATLTTVYNIAINATTVGTITFDAGATSGTIVFTSPGSVPPNGMISVTGPAVPDTTLANVSILLKEV